MLRFRLHVVCCSRSRRSLWTGNRERIYAALDEGHADLAITASKPDGGNLGFAELDRERLLLVAAPALAERSRARAVTADFLCGLPRIAYDETLPLLRPFLSSGWQGRSAKGRTARMNSARQVCRHFSRALPDRHRTRFLRVPRTGRIAVRVDRSPDTRQGGPRIGHDS
ncbi:LysR substrate-binding domain-containing protein [Novosphingobium sp. Rr 2-17]|uniref:LysR substrate-binding domain-containing protein n=1 Tax=Novosphingobium sp. Rr 2-17 TaxID=555793 RepID=UPI000A024FC4